MCAVATIMPAPEPDATPPRTHDAIFIDLAGPFLKFGVCGNAESRCALFAFVLRLKLHEDAHHFLRAIFPIIFLSRVFRMSMAGGGGMGGGRQSQA